MWELEGEVVLVTDVRGELARELVHASISAGCRKVYACAPHVAPWTSRLVVPLVLDARSDVSVSCACAAASDVTAVISTAASAHWPPVAISAGDTATLADHFAATVLTTARVAAAFAPTLARNGGMMACVESVQAWINLSGAYAVAQAALWSTVNSLRMELRGSGVHVMAAITGLVESQHPSIPLAAQMIVTGIRDRSHEVVLDEYTGGVRTRLSGPLEEIYPELT